MTGQTPSPFFLALLAPDSHNSQSLGPQSVFFFRQSIPPPPTYLPPDEMPMEKPTWYSAIFTASHIIVGINIVVPLSKSLDSLMRHFITLKLLRDYNICATRCIFFI